MNDLQPKLKGYNSHFSHPQTFAWEGGRRVAVVDVEFPDETPERERPRFNVGAFLDWLAGDRIGDPEYVGRRVELLRYVARTPNAAKTQRELAARLGVSKTMVTKLLAKTLQDAHESASLWVSG